MYIYGLVHEAGSAQIGHVDTNYIISHNKSYLSTGIEYFHSVACVINSEKSLTVSWPYDYEIKSYW